MTVPCRRGACDAPAKPVRIEPAAGNPGVASATLGTSEETTAKAGAPLLVPLEGALLRTDPALEAGLALLRRQPLALLAWLVRGARTPLLAAARAAGCAPDAALLPLEPALVADLEVARRRGQRLLLWTRGDPELARAIADRLGLFEGVVVESDAARAAASLGANIAAVRRPRPAGRVALGLWLQAIRVHQWAKNLLVLLPVLLAGPLATVADWTAAAVAFLVLSLTASAGYLINDLLDLEADRRHPTKRERPFASGELPLRAGLSAVPALLAPAAVVASLLPRPFAFAGAGYLLLTLAYSLALKRIPLLDVVVLGGLFSIRVLAGAEVISAPFSYWLLTIAMFLFLSLALVKRYAELDQLVRHGGSELSDRGGYSTNDLPLLLALGVSAGMVATSIFVVYLVTEQVPRPIYSRPGWLWLVFPVLLLWLARVWRLALHGRMSQDPVLFALTDRPSLAMGAAVLACLIAAW